MAALVSVGQRWKQRRLRSWWRCEQVSIAAALATALHHSARKMITVDKEVQTLEFFQMSDDEKNFVVFPPPAVHAAPALLTECHPWPST